MRVRSIHPCLRYDPIIFDHLLADAETEAKAKRCELQKPLHRLALAPYALAHTRALHSYASLIMQGQSKQMEVLERDNILIIIYKYSIISRTIANTTTTSTIANKRQPQQEKRIQKNDENEVPVVSIVQLFN